MDKPYPDEPLVKNLNAQMPRLKELLAEADGHWGFENWFYRFSPRGHKDRGHDALRAKPPPSKRFGDWSSQGRRFPLAARP